MILESSVIWSHTVIEYTPNHSVMLSSFRVLDEDLEEDVGLVLKESAVLVNAFSVHRW